MKAWALAIAGALVVLAAGIAASWVQSSGGAVSVRDIRFRGDGGQVLSALLYVPRGATPDHPAPAVLVSHGFINTREMQSPFAIELSRRGFVVLAIDMSGHGASGGVLMQNGAGGPAALRYLRAQPFVDPARIGLEGHSMGAGPVLSAAAALPDGYRSVVLEGTAPGVRVLGAPPGTPAFPRNLAVVFGRYDEFAPLMWEVPRGADVAASPKMRALFGTADPVVADQLYGDIQAGTARRLTVPAINHPLEHFSPAGVAPAVDWFQQTLPGVGAPRDPNDQVWIWKEVATGIGFVGAIMLMLGVFRGLTATWPFRGLDHPFQPTASRWTFRWWLGWILTGAVPAALYFPLMKVAPVVFFTPFALAGRLPWARAQFAEQITNQLVVWALGSGLAALVLSLFLRQGRSAFSHRWIAAPIAAALSVGAAYLALMAVGALFTVDFRFWVLGLRLMDARQWGFFANYLPFFLVFFLVAGRAFAASLPVRGENAFFAAAFGAKGLALGFAVLLILQYVSLLTRGVLLFDEPLNTIIAYQFVAILAVIGLTFALTVRRTGSYLPGAVMMALFVTWYIVAGTAVFPAA